MKTACFRKKQLNVGFLQEQGKIPSEKDPQGLFYPW